MSQFKEVLSSAGVYYTTLYAVRWVWQRVLAWLDRRLVSVEQRKGLTQTWTISARRYTAADNKKMWNEYDWARSGEEWTPSAEWKAQVLQDYMTPYFHSGGTYLEIGPGGGRWTEVLQKLAAKLYVVDVAERPLELCRQRFQGCTNIAYLLGNGRTLDVSESAIDAVWSFDVFVHITPQDVKGYFQEFRRILKPGGLAVIHHAGPPVPGKVERVGWRSDLTDKMVQQFAEECGLQIVLQSQKLVNPGDVLTILKRPA